MIQTFFIHPHESIKFPLPRSQFSPQVHHHGRGKGFFSSQKRWVELWKDKSSKWLLDSENQRCQKQGFLQINVALEVNDPFKTSLPELMKQITTKIMFCLFSGHTIQQMAGPFPELLLFQTRFLRRFPHERSAGVELPWRSC